MIDEARLAALESIPIDELINLIEIGTVESLQRAAALAETLPHIAVPEASDDESEGEGVRPTTMEHKPPWSEGGVSVREPRRPNSMDESAGIPSAKPGYIPPPVKPGAYRIPFARYGPSKPGALRRPSHATRDHPGVGTTVYKSLIAKHANIPSLAERVLRTFVKADLQGPTPREGHWGVCIRCGGLYIQTGDQNKLLHVVSVPASHVATPGLPGTAPAAVPEQPLGTPAVTVNVTAGSPPPSSATDSIPLLDTEKFRGRSRARYSNPMLERIERESRAKALEMPRGPIANPNAVTPPDRGVAAQGPPPQPGSTGICERCGGILVLNQRGRWAHVIELPTSHVGVPRIDSIGRAVEIPK